ncbi:MAG TPA: hypothetical protein VFX64_02555 [Candidatus Nitrosotalea sp.]|nr:hypothetical protein [Candidatus Nitrosotalea sp.]
MKTLYLSLIIIAGITMATITIITFSSLQTNVNPADGGILSGKVVLVGGPRLGPRANYEVDVYATNGNTIVGKTFSDVNAHYSIPLPAGEYIIYAQDYPKPVSHLVSVFKGNTTTFDIFYGSNYK